MSVLTSLTYANRVALQVYKLLATGVFGYLLIRDIRDARKARRRGPL